MSKPEQFLQQNGGIVLLLLGIALVAISLFFDAPAEVLAVLAGVGSGMVLISAVLPRIEGLVKFPGIEFQLRPALEALEERSDEKKLTPDERAEAVDTFLTRWRGEVASGGRGPLPEPRTLMMLNPWVENLVEEALADVEAPPMRPVPVQSLPSQILSTIQEAAGLTQPPEAVSAEQRAGRGAPRWHVTTAKHGRWRVVNTRHGWSARPM